MADSASSASSLRLDQGHDSSCTACKIFDMSCQSDRSLDNRNCMLAQMQLHRGIRGVAPCHRCIWTISQLHLHNGKRKVAQSQRRRDNCKRHGCKCTMTQVQTHHSITANGKWCNYNRKCDCNGKWKCTTEKLQTSRPPDVICWSIFEASTMLAAS